MHISLLVVAASVAATSLIGFLIGWIVQSLQAPAPPPASEPADDHEPTDLTRRLRPRSVATTRGTAPR